MSQPNEPLVVHSVSNDGLIVEVRRRIATGGITRADIFDADSDGEAAGGSMDDFEGSSVDMSQLDKASARFKRGEYSDALYHLEAALGRDFLGLGDLVLGRAS